MVERIVKMQIGKKGVSSELIMDIAKNFKKKGWVKISVLKNHSRNKAKIKEEAEHIRKELERITNKRYITKVIGFTINIRKWRK